jgi:hypothetical protein
MGKAECGAMHLPTHLHTAGSTNRWLTVQASPSKKQDPISKVTRAKGLEVWLKWWSAYLWSTKPWVQILPPPTHKSLSRDWAFRHYHTEIIHTLVNKDCIFTQLRANISPFLPSFWHKSQTLSLEGELGIWKPEFSHIASKTPELSLNWRLVGVGGKGKELWIEL